MCDRINRFYSLKPDFYGRGMTRGKAEHRATDRRSFSGA